MIGARSASLGCWCQSITTLSCWRSTSSMPDVLRVEPVVGLVDVVGIGQRRAEDDRDAVVGERAPQRPAGRGRGDEVERAAERARAARRGRPCLLARRSSFVPPPPQAATSATTATRQHEAASRRDSLRGRVGLVQHTAIVRRRADRIDQRLEQYARLTVQVGLNLQPGQTLCINALHRARAASPARSRGRHTRRAHATSTCSTPTSTCAARTSSTRPRTSSAARRRGSSSGCSELGETGGALCAITGNPEPELFADLDGGRVGKARMREVAEASLALTDGLCNWTIVAYPNAGWAQTVFGEPDVERLWEAVATAVRLDEPDPVAAWREHIARLAGARAGAERAALRRPALPRPGHRPDDRAAPRVGSGRRRSTSRHGIEHVANMPTEEVFTTPDASRVEGTVRSTLPLQIQGTIVRGLEVRFEGGRAVEVHADVGRGGDARRTSRPTTARRASARSRSSTATRASARPGSSSTTRSSTRTRRRTSRSARRSCRRSPWARRALARASGTSAASTTRRSTPTS